MTVASANDLQLPGTGPPHGGQHLRPLIARIADHTLDERELTTHLAQQQLGAIAVLHPCRVNDHAQQQPERVGQNVALAPNGLLARIVTRRVERGAPF